MTKARTQQISLDSTTFYHCYVRCVRRAFLCGDDVSSGNNYDHRKQWIVSRLRFLSYVYAIDICAYAVMSNHYHVVLHVDVERSKAWSKEEVAERWMQLFKGDILVDRWLKEPNTIDVVTMEKVDEIIEQWRDRLSSVSWFMRNVNEKIARMANEEENCKGRFWEGRFRSQALLDEAALLSCMAYVDLNPVRAGIAADLATSDFTSVQQRLYEYSKDSVQAEDSVLEEPVKKQDQCKESLQMDKQPEAPLMLFDGSVHTALHMALPFTQQDYFDLVDKTGRLLRSGKRGAIAAELPTIISQLGIDPEKWLDHVKGFGRSYSECAGSAAHIREYAARFDRRWGKGIACSNYAYLDAAA